MPCPTVKARSVFETRRIPVIVPSNSSQIEDCTLFLSLFGLWDARILQVRVYRPEKVFEELKAAREEYLQSNISLHKDRVLIPKLVQNYVKNSGMSLDDLLSIVLLNATSPDSSSRIQQPRWKRKPSKFIQWIPHNFEFRYLLSNELA